MDEEIPYADDLPYDEPVPAAPEETAATSLKERIGNRIYLLEDLRKRKLVNTEETPEDDEDAEDTNADLPHRPNALLLRGPPISQLPTARVFAYATHFDAHPIGLEWVDDQTCVLVFTSRKHALQAWDALRRPSQEGDSTTAMQLNTEEAEELFPAPPLPLALYPIEERINTALGSEKSAILKEMINIRWALPSDVKQQGARVRSEFYKKHGETAGKEGLPGILQHKRRRYNEDDSDTRRRLDEDLDTFEEGQSSELVGGKRKRPQNEEARKLLDDELDSFLAHGSEPRTEAVTDSDIASVPSLVDRTTRPLPRRSRRSADRDRGESRGVSDDGRWLHNAEMRRRSIWADDEDGYGMRAWRAPRARRSAGSGKGRKPHKTQEELDRELEEFLGE